MKTGLSIVVLLLLAGCAYHPYNPDPYGYNAKFQEALDRRARAPVYPASAVATVACGANCATLMQRAQAWVVANADYKIQTSSPTLVQTFGPITDQIGEAFTVTSADGAIRIQGSYAGTDHCDWTKTMGACFDPAPSVNALAEELRKP